MQADSDRAGFRFIQIGENALAEFLTVDAGVDEIFTKSTDASVLPIR
ncbi:MAG: hypothetical protein ABR545_12190 [Cyclonatronaceae bacterium]